MRMKASRTSRTLVTALLAVAVIVVVAVACGGSGKTDQEPTNVTDARDQATSSPQVPATTQASTAPTSTESPLVADLQKVEALDEPTSTPVETSSEEVVERLATPSLSVGGEVGDRAPEFSDIANWINSEPLTMEELRGKVVLIDFWTYTCVNCIRTMPYLREWQEKYADSGLAIIGVHSPEFDFEKLPDNVERNTLNFGLEYPVAQDNNMGTWRAYSNRFWPAKYLIDKAGIVRYTHFGEGAYGETEKQIRVLLEEAGADLSSVALNTAPEPQIVPQAYAQNDPETRITREIYGGYERNNSPRGIYIAHTEYYSAPEQVVIYTDPGNHENQFAYLQGPWFNGPEELRHARETENYEDYIALKFFATSVNAVIDPGGGDPFEVQVTIDGRPLRPEEAGADVIVTDARSYFRVDEARMYEVVALPDFSGHELKLSANSPDFSFFAFTFGAYAEGP